MRTILRLFYVMIVFSLGFLSAHAAKPGGDYDCHAVEAHLEGSKSFVYTDDPNIMKVTIARVNVDCLHKDGTPENVPLGEVTGTVRAKNWKEAEDAVKAWALQEGQKKLKQQYCPKHGCDKK